MNKKIRRGELCSLTVERKEEVGAVYICRHANSKQITKNNNNGGVTKDEVNAYTAYTSIQNIKGAELLKSRKGRRSNRGALHQVDWEIPFGNRIC